MEDKHKTVRMARKQALSMKEVVDMYIKSMKISSGLNTQRIFAAWDDVSGAGKYTLKRFFRDGKLYITVGSSVIRSQLYFQKDALIDKMNERLMADDLFTKDDARVSYVKELILK